MNDKARAMDLIFIGDVCLPAPEDGARMCASLKDASSGRQVLIANLEGALTARDRPVAGRYATFRDAPAGVERLAGLDVALLANNHSGDFGPEGGTDTLDTLSGAGIATVGFGRLHAAGTLARCVAHDGRTVAIVNACCPTANPPGFAMVERAGAAPLCPALLSAAIREARDANDAVVCCLHWGPEMHTLPAPEQMAMARWAVASGADAVIGHHAHVIQTAESIDGAPVFYGLGNAWFPETGWFGSDPNGQPAAHPNRLSERERVSLAVTLRFQPERRKGRRLAVVAVRRLRFAAPAPPLVVEALSDRDVSPAIPPLRRLMAARLHRRLRRRHTLDCRAAMRQGRLSCWYASLCGWSGLAMRYEAALYARRRRGLPV